MLESSSSLLSAAARHGVRAALAANHPDDTQDDLSPAAKKVTESSYEWLFLYLALFIVAGCLIAGFCAMYVLSLKKEVGLRRWTGFMHADQASESHLKELDHAKAKTGAWEIAHDKTNLLLVFVPLGWAAHVLHWGHTTVFVLNLIAVLPLANLMGVATEELTIHTGPTIGGLLNATFGNAVELIIVVQSLREGLVRVTKGTILGSILANELLVLGMAFLFGGFFDPQSANHPWPALGRSQSYSKVGAMVQAQLLLFSAFTVVMPSIFSHSHHVSSDHVLHISRVGSIFILIGYVVYLVFQLYTHQNLLQDEATKKSSDSAESGHEEEEEEHETARISASMATGLLIVATLVVATSSECLVHAIEGFTADSGFSETFVGVVLLPIVGNACEHSTAIVVALKDKMDLAIGIALGSTIQVSLFVLPFAVVAGWILGMPMDLDLERINAWALVLSSLLVMCILVTGRSFWINGFVLTSTYLVLAVLYFFTPDRDEAHPPILTGHG